MVEIINQRKAFDMRWRGRGTDNGRQKTRNHGAGCHGRRELFTDYSDHPLQTCHVKPKTQINRRRTLPAASSCWWDAYRKQLGLKDFSPKSQDALWHCSRLRSVALYL